jgi:predicted DNA-binding transcriptional regulator AlpA
MNPTEGQTINRAQRRAAAAAERQAHRPKLDTREAPAAAVERQAHRPKLDTRKAAEHCGLGHSTLVKYRVFGGGPPFFKIGRRVVYDPHDLDEWLKDRRRFSTSDRGNAHGR